MKNLFLIILFTLLSYSNSLFGQENQWPADLSLMGNAGFIVSPTANISADRYISVGLHLVHEKAGYTSYSKQEQSAEQVLFTTIGFLPFMEVTLRLTKPFGKQEPRGKYGLGDRSIFLRMQVLKEKEKLPAITIAAHDLFSTVSFFNTVYIVGSKHFELGANFIAHTSLGYGTRLRETRAEYLQGIFGGVSIQWKNLQAIFEYDANQFNTGLKCHLWKKVFLQASALDMKYLSGGLALQ
ncbi:MAG TPA: hypothetical protein ENK52_02475, partial [Saprospiraceae bacterium]|nr:hypothetical protein [Saprospiraceae bacterium]